MGAAVFTRSRKEAFSGSGGLYASARWHTAGHPIVYTAQSLSLAALEILVRLKQTNDIQPFFAYAAEVPDPLILKPNSYPARWKSRVAVSRAFGDAWLNAKSSPAMLVPTTITPGRMECAHQPTAPTVLTDMDRGRARCLHLRCAIASDQEKDSVREILVAALMTSRDGQNSGQKVDMEASSFCKSLIIGAPYEIRTRVTALRGPCPRPLDEGSGLADLWALVPEEGW